MISPYNCQLKIKEDKYLIGKANPNSEEFDNLLFAVCDINKIFIPSNIKIILSYAFDHCDILTKVEIPPNSNLQTIESYAFYGSNIKKNSISKIYNCMISLISFKEI